MPRAFIYCTLFPRCQLGTTVGMAPRHRYIHLVAIWVLYVATSVNAQGYCRTSYQVSNCSMCGISGTSSFPDECREGKGVYKATVECLCTRPNFARDAKQCEQAIHLIGFVDNVAQQMNCCPDLALQFSFFLLLMLVWAQMAKTNTVMRCADRGG